jgi:transposase
LKSRGQQRSDSTHVLASIRVLNRLECVGETLRAALNSLALVQPAWLRERVCAEWFERYGQRFDQWRLPEKQAERAALGQAIGQDGYALLQAVYACDAPAWLREISAVEVLRRVWVQQYCVEADTLRWRTAEELPPAAQLIVSPYDDEARNSVKRQTEWTGYKVHLTETCEDDLPALITNVETTPSTTPDVRCTATIHQHLADKELLPNAHWVDRGYVDAAALVDSQAREIDLIGPASAESSWQARMKNGFDTPSFQIDWEAQLVTCPAGKVSTRWSESHDSQGQPIIEVRFARRDCLSCPQQTQCTRSAKGVRTLKLQTQARQTALQQARQRQQTAEFKEKYKRRAGVEGTLSQAIRKFGLRRARYKGLPKTHLQHVVTAVAIDLARLVDWFAGKPRAATRYSAFAALALA